MVQSYVEFGMLLDWAMHDSSELNIESMPFRCPGCQTQPGWYRRDQFIIMGCPCGAAALDYSKLPFFPQTEHEWSQWLASLTKLDLGASVAASRRLFV
jgi:hypothetical protein